MSSTELTIITTLRVDYPAVPIAWYHNAVSAVSAAITARESLEDPQSSRALPLHATGHTQELAPVDGGKAAWRLLGTAFVFETLL